MKIKKHEDQEKKIKTGRKWGQIKTRRTRKSGRKWGQIKKNRRIGEMDANFSSLKTMHDLGKLISFTLFWERKKNEGYIKNIMN